MRLLLASLAIALLAACSQRPAPAPPAQDDASPPVAATDPTPTPAQAAPAPAVDTPPAPAEAADPCDWTRIALPQHRAMVEATPQSLLDAVAAADGDVAQLRPLLERPALPLGEIDGAWRVRSLQSNLGSVFAYPYFAARIAPADCGHAFAKTTGSQRRTGVLYPIAGQPDRLAFLGASTVNDDPPRGYDPARPAGDQRPGEENSAGVLYRIGPDELLALLDARGDGRFEVYHLRR